MFVRSPLRNMQIVALSSYWVEFQDSIRSYPTLKQAHIQVYVVIWHQIGTDGSGHVTPPALLAGLKFLDTQRGSSRVKVTAGRVRKNGHT